MLEETQLHPLSVVVHFDLSHPIGKSVWFFRVLIFAVTF